MSENLGAQSAGAPLADNEYARQLFGILQAGGRDTSGLLALLSHVSEMDDFVKRAEETISVMNSPLADMKEVQSLTKEARNTGAGTRPDKRR
jgi:hypothetical protein